MAQFAIRRFCTIFVQVGEFNDVKNLSLGFSGSYEVEPQLERVHQLLRWSSSLSSGNDSSQLMVSLAIRQVFLAAAALEQLAQGLEQQNHPAVSLPSNEANISISKE